MVNETDTNILGEVEHVPMSIREITRRFVHLIVVDFPFNPILDGLPMKTLRASQEFD